MTLGRHSDAKLIDDTLLRFGSLTVIPLILGRIEDICQRAVATRYLYMEGYKSAQYLTAMSYVLGTGDILPRLTSAHAALFAEPGVGSGILVLWT